MFSPVTAHKESEERKNNFTLSGFNHLPRHTLFKRFENKAEILFIHHEFQA